MPPCVCSLSEEEKGSTYAVGGVHCAGHGDGGFYLVRWGVLSPRRLEEGGRAVDGRVVRC